MEKKDRYARLALEYQPVGSPDMEVVSPPEISAPFFTPAKSNVPPLPEPSYGEALAGFREKLGNLKTRYRPFTRDYSPQEEYTRNRRELTEFEFRFEEDADQRDFSRILDGKGSWEKISIPDYRGPQGRWTAFYRTRFFREPLAENRRLFLRFLSVDYRAAVYLNGRCLGGHEGFFSPFEFDVTDFLQRENTLVVEVKNDAPTVGLENIDGSPGLDGDKIYAATGPGWDDSQIGWHHCPPGGGIFHKVILEERSELFIHSLFVRPDIDGAKAEAWFEIYNTRFAETPFELSVSVFPRNFESGEPDAGESGDPLTVEVKPAGPGHNYYRIILSMDGFRLWSPETPWLYAVRGIIKTPAGSTLDILDSSFGMRKFHMDQEHVPYGTLYLNNKPVLLRGANDMGHMQQCVIRGDFDQLIEDILIAKAANMNYYRFTQRPVQEEIYHYCDMLGMMNQTDLPLFGYLRRNQFNEAVRQAGEMERLIRGHPSSIMVSYINEPFSVIHHGKGHRHLYRPELESFFESAARAVHIENPDRVVKNVEGDYDPPTREGLSDFHCYNMWYTNHALPLGQLHKGYLPQIRRNWKTGVGEYGTEGLDPLNVMMEDYPKNWLPASPEEPWTPENIIRAQSYSMHGDWYEEQYTIGDWIRESQRHQALATRLMTDAFRRRADLIISTAVHLLIDAWPSGWMKTLVDHRRVPKPSYFELMRSYAPRRVNLRTDRLRVYQGESISIEAWILNDLPADIEGAEITVTFHTPDTTAHGSYRCPARAAGAGAVCGGILNFTVPAVKGSLYADAQLCLPDEGVINSERLELQVYPRRSDCSGKALVIENPEQYREDTAQRVNAGETAIIMLDGFDEGAYRFGDIEINVEPLSGVYFAARSRTDPLTADFGPQDFSYPYSKSKGCIAWVAEKSIASLARLTPILYSYQKPKFSECIKGEKNKLPVLASGEYGKGRFYFTTIPYKDFAGFNPVFDMLIERIKLLDFPDISLKVKT
jgi:hypothetical protein